MGWTHSWQRPTELPAKRFAAAVEDCRKILPALGVPMAGFDGTGEPILTDEQIVFNGQAGSQCAPFEIAVVEFDRRGRETVWSFCKTEHAPYDICVQTALVVLKHHLVDGITVTSDGRDDDWSKARQACQEKLGYGEGFVLEIP